MKYALDDDGYPSARTWSNAFKFKQQRKQGEAVNNNSRSSLYLKRSTSFIAGFLLLAASAGAELNPLPLGFVKKVESGWLPPICERGESMPEPIIRKWAEWRAGGPVRVLFITGKKPGMYECLSLAKAFDLECDLIPFWNSWKRTETNAKPLGNFLRYCLGSKQYDIIAVSGVWLSYLPDDCEQKIADLVQNEGVGLVYAMHGIFPRVPSMQGIPSPILDPLLPLDMNTSAYKKLTKRAVPVGNSPLAGGQVFSAIRWMCNVDTTLREGATALLENEDGSRVLAAIVNRGKGRVMAYNHAHGEYSRRSPYFIPLAFSDRDISPGVSMMKAVKQEGMGKFCRWINGIEYADQFYGWLGKSIMWAAKKEAKPALKSVATEAGKYRIKFSIPASTERVCRIRTVVRSALNSKQEMLEENCTMPPGSEEITLALPATGMSGKHFIDIYLLNNKGAVHDWLSASFNIQSKMKVDYTPDYRVYSPSGTINLDFKATVPPGVETITVATELFDLKGRLLINQTRKLTTRGRAALDVPVQMNLSDTVIKSRLANARFTFRTSDDTVELRDQFFVRQSPAWDQYHIGTHAGYVSYDPMYDMFAKAHLQAGFDTLSCNYPSPVRCRLQTETGLRIWGNWLISRGNTPERMKRLIGWFKDFSPVKYGLQDEPELQFYPPSIDRFAGPGFNEHFQNWLKKKYVTLENLNKAWGREYGDWKAVVRPLWYEALDSDNWTAWFDSRRDLDDYFFEKYSSASDSIKKTVPNVLVSVNPRSLGTFSGLNLGDFSRSLGSAHLYNDYVRGNSAMSYLHLGWRRFNSVETYIGYVWVGNPGIKRTTREAWDSVRRGANIFWHAAFTPLNPPHADMSYMNGDFTMNAAGKPRVAVNKILLSGPGDLAVNTEPLTEGIFVYYPRSLFYNNDLRFFKQSLLNDPEQDVEKMRGMKINTHDNQVPNSFLPHLDALGYQYESGDEQELTSERLLKTRVVLLQNIICLSPEKLKLLRNFVNNGGCVIAEAGTARRDGNGKVYTETPEAFKDIFGIERTEPNLSPIISEEKMRIVSDKANDKEFTSGGYGRIFSKGKAFFINFHLPKSNTGINLVRKIMTAAGVEPTYQLKSNWLETGTQFNLICSMVVREKGDLTYLYLTGDGNKVDDDFTVELPGPRFVYDVLADKNLGRLESIEGKITYGEARLFALSPSPVRSLKIMTNKEKLSPGEWVNLDFKLTTKSGTPGDRLVMLEHHSQTGGNLPDIPRKVMLNNGKAALRVFVPYNASPGIFELTARDLTSGAKANISLKN